MNLSAALRAPRTALERPLARPLDTALALALGALGIFLPFSTAGVSVCLLVLLLLALAAAPALWRLAPWRDPVMAVGLALLAYITAHTLWTNGAVASTWHLANRYHELLVAPVLLALFRLVTRKRSFLWGLLLGLVGYATVHWAALLSPALELALRPRRISAGFVMALGAFLLLELARGSSRPWAWRTAAAYLAATVLFAIDGRTGHLVLVLLVACAAWLHSPRRWRWIATLTLPVVVLAIAMGSTAVQKRVTETLNGSQGKDGSELTSTGIRIEFLRNGVLLAQRHWITGAGYLNYAQLHSEMVREQHNADPVGRPAPGAFWERTVNPHNEYLMQLIGGGLPALVLFIAWLVLPAMRRTPSGELHAALVGAGLAFGMGCLFNSLLMDFTEGHFYTVLLAWVLAQTGPDALAESQPA